MEMWCAVQDDVAKGSNECIYLHYSGQDILILNGSVIVDKLFD